jgi:hypothetical protein
MPFSIEPKVPSGVPETAPFTAPAAELSPAMITWNGFDAEPSAFFPPNRRLCKSCLPHPAVASVKIECLMALEFHGSMPQRRYGLAELLRLLARGRHASAVAVFVQVQANYNFTCWHLDPFSLATAFTSNASAVGVSERQASDAPTPTASQGD